MIQLRLARELTYQLEHAGEDERLALALAIPQIFLLMFEGESMSEVLGLWQRLSETAREPERFYTLSLEKLRKIKSENLIDFLRKLHLFFDERSNYEYAISLLNELLNLSKLSQNLQNQMESLNGLGWIAMIQGRYEESVQYLSKSLLIARQQNDQKNEARTLSTLGGVDIEQGRYLDALLNFESSLKIATSLGDKPAMARAVGNIGIVRRQQGRFAEAMNYFEQSLSLAHSNGDMNTVGRLTGNIATIHWEEGRHNEALIWLERNLAIAESIGDKRGIALAIGNLGTIYVHLGDNIKAMESFQRWIQISESIEDLSSQAMAFGNLGTIHSDEGRHSEAMRCYQRSLDLAKSMSDKREVSRSLINMGNIYLKEGRPQDALESYELAITIDQKGDHSSLLPHWLLGSSAAFIELFLAYEKPEYSNMTDTTVDWRSSHLKNARERATEIITISEHNSKKEVFFHANILLARIDAAEGNNALATEKLESMLDGTTNEEQIADLHYWLWKIGEESNHKCEALDRYESLWERIQKFEFRKRIAELKGERIPKSADELEEAVT
jgi:tetratricopeptide (TPR) repeat protein